MFSKVDSDWLKLLNQKPWVYCSLSLFCGLLRYLIYEDYLPSLASVGWLPDAALVGALLFGLLAAGSLVHSASHWADASFKKYKLCKKILLRLNSLSDVEHRILSYLVTSNHQSFNYRIDDGDIQQLVQKGLLQMAYGHQNILAIPFFVPDFVWKELLRRQSDFCSAAPPDDPPWVKSWMAY